MVLGKAYFDGDHSRELLGHVWNFPTWPKKRFKAPSTKGAVGVIDQNHSVGRLRSFVEDSKSGFFAIEF